MKRRIIYSGILLGIGGLGALILIIAAARERTPQAVPTASAQSRQAVVVAAPGRVEPASEEVKVGSELSGRLRTVQVEEGDRVRQGQIIATLENADYRARVASAEAQISQRAAEQRRVTNGARHQERREVLATVGEAEAVLKNAQLELERLQALYRTGDIAQEEVDRAERETRVARARYEVAVQRHSLVNDQAREEDLSKAAADIELARAQLEEARAQLEKTYIRSPIAGVILRKHLHAGESVSGSPEMPIVTVANVTTLRVRVDVDESDVGKVRLGQRAFVTADAYGGEKFGGHVVRIGQILGKKNIRTDEPSERVDTKILETLVELDDGHRLVTGLRVNAFILVSE